MKIIRGLLYTFFLLSMLAGCGANPQATHEGSLLDNKVSAQRVQSALRSAGHEFRHVRVEATEHGVTLKGTVRSEKERSRAEDIARGTDREMNLSNELRVK